MKREIRNYLLGAAAVIAVIIVGCNGTVPSHTTEASEKLSKNAVLKRGWVELSIPMYISEDFPEEFKDAVIEAMDMWNFEAGVDLFEYMGETDILERDFDTVNVVHWDDTVHPKGYYAEAFTMFVSDTVIIEGDIVFYGDPDTFDILSCEDGEKVCISKTKKKDVITTALHELGHILGFVHSEGATDIMNPEFYPGQVHREFDSELIAELLSVYSSVMVAENNK